MTESIRKKEKAVKASFKIEMTDQERQLRDSQVTNQYHTGNLNQSSNASTSELGMAAGAQVTMSKADEEELQADRLA